MPVRLILALCGGLALWAAFPGIGLWPAASVGVGLLAMATCGVRARAGFGLGLATGVAFFTPLLSWSGIYVGVLPWLALALLQAGYLGLLGMACAWLQRGRPGWSQYTAPGSAAADRPQVRPMVVGVAWVTQELLRSHTPFGGFPWGRLAFSQAEAPVGRLAALGGAPAVSFAVAVAGGVLAAVALSVLTARGSRANRTRRLVPGVVTVALLLLGPGLLPLPLGPQDNAPLVQVLAVQGNVPRPGLDFNAERRAVLDNHVTQTELAALAIADRSRPDLVVWPENSSDIDPTRNPDARAAIARAVAAVRAPVLAGAVLEEPADHSTNASLLYTPQSLADQTAGGGAGYLARYDKRHPVPFAEYIPFPAFFRLFSDKVDLVRRPFVAGTEVGVLEVPSLSRPSFRIGVSICFEVAADDLVLDGVREGAEILVVQTNNATFGYTHESVQQLAISRIRAIEHGRAVAHVSNVGVSALIQPDGTTGETTSLFTATTLQATLPARAVWTPATWLGPWPARAAAAVLAGFVGSALWRRRR